MTMIKSQFISHCFVCTALADKYFTLTSALTYEKKTAN